MRISVLSITTNSGFDIYYERCIWFDHIHTIYTVEKSATVYITTIKDQYFLYYLMVHPLLNKISTLSIFVSLVLSTFLAYYFPNEIQTTSATTVSPNDQVMPFDMEMFEIGQSQNQTAENSSNIVTNDNQDKPVGCEMPPCPP